MDGKNLVSDRCGSPICEKSIETLEDGWRRTEKRYCSDGCRMDVYALRRVAKLYGLEVQAVHEALTNLSLTNDKSRASR